MTKQKESVLTCVLYRMKYTSGLLGGVGAGVGMLISGASSGFLTKT